jgi:PAS domain S-box-containing protein
MGAGISSMHYIGMAAMRLPAVCRFNSFLLVLSVVFAVLISLAALWITFHFRDEKKGIGWEKLGGAVVMGAAIPVMHYTGMAAASFTPSVMPADLSHAVSISTLGTAGIAAVTFIVIGLTLLMSWMDRRFAARTLELQEEKLQQSEAYLAEAQRLSHTGSFGWRPSTGEIIWSEETFRVFQYDRTTTPTVELILQRVHPEETAFVRQTIERASQDGKGFDFEHRLRMPNGSVKHLRVVGRPSKDESGSLEFVGAVMDISDRKRAEEKLRRSEADLLEAQRMSRTGNMKLDVSSGTVTVSPQVFRIFGVKPDEDTSTPEFWLSRTHLEDEKRIRELFDRSIIQKTDFDADYSIVLPDGAIKHLHSVGHPVLNESGELVEFIGTVMDITERKQAEEALRRSESYLAEAQRLTHTASWAWRVAGKDFLHLSEEWYRIYGFDSEKGMPAWEEVLQRIHPEDRTRWQGSIDRAVGEKSDYEMEYRILFPSGTVKYLQTVGHPVLSSSGALVQFLGSAMDITERKQAEEALRRSEGNLAEAQRLTRVGSWAWSFATRHAVYWSQEHYRIFGFDPEGGIPSDESFFQRIHPEDRDRFHRECFYGRWDQASDFVVDYRIVLPDKTIKYIRTTGHPLVDASGNLLEHFGAAMDVTERKQAEEALRQAQADLAHASRVTTMGELTASLAHEVKQPIAAACTNANTCLRWLAGDTPNIEEARAAAMRIVKDGKRAAEIISRIRLLFKKGTPQYELLDVNEVIGEMIVLLRGETTRYSISVRTELGADLPRIIGDRVQLQQVLMNLMINGIDAMKSVDGTRELAIKSQRAKNEEVVVSVTDNGVGLPPQQEDQIFDAFFTTKPHGTGMGLRISRSIIESHGGRLWAAGNSPRGATFLFTLPTKAEAHE